jgi:hypothetical protein
VFKREIMRLARRGAKGYALRVNIRMSIILIRRVIMRLARKGAKG